MTRFPRQLLALATSGVLTLVACSDVWPSAERSPSSNVSVSPDVAVSPEPGPTTLDFGSEALPAATYLLDLDAGGLGEEHFPNITLTVPDGWNNLDGWGVARKRDGDNWMAITFWDVDEVYTHPCQWQGRKAQPGPTVADLARALTKVPLRDATEPEDIVVDGFQGVQVQWSVPAGIDFSTCDRVDSVMDPLFRSWTATESSGGGDRYQQGPGQVDRLWILDVDGERLVVDAMYMPSTDATHRRELWQVMESIRFET